MSFKSPYICFILVILCLMPIFGHMDSRPIQLWDESRLSINAFEMMQGGNWLIPTYNGNPDMWNTKPPLMIWLQAVCLKVVGLNEIAIRLPSALAAFVTISLLFWFCAKYLKRPWLGFISCVVLLSAGGYIRMHGVRTGDYDALLVLFTTAYALMFFLYTETVNKKYLYLTFFFLSLAVLTKGIGGVLLCPSLVLYALYRKQLLSILKTKHLYFGLVGFLVIALGYYLLREQYNPGYITAVWQNELGGRYGSVIEGHKGEWDHYLTWLRTNGIPALYPFIIPGFLLGLISKEAKIKHLAVFSFILVSVLLLVLSLSATKINWYDMPAYPFHAILIALMIYSVAGMILQLRENSRAGARYYIVVIIFIGAFLLPSYWYVFKRVTRPSISELTNAHNVMAYVLKDVLHGDRNLESYKLVWNGFSTDVEWYLDVLIYQNYDIEGMAVKDLQGDEKVVAYSRDIKNELETRFHAVATDSFKMIKFYQLNGLRD